MQQKKDIEQRTIAKLKNGDEPTFERIYKSLYAELFTFCKGYLLSEENAKEVTQEVFFTLWENRKNLADNTHLRAYLFTIARHKCLNFLRTSRFRATIMAKGSEQELALNEQALIDNSFDNIFNHDLVKILHTAISELPDSCRDYFIMSKLQGLKYSEIAEQKQVSVKNVEYHISKAFAILQKRFSHLSQDDLFIALLLLSLSLYA